MTSVILPSGRPVEIRPIAPSDATELAFAYRRLSPDSKYQRFFALKPHLTASELRYLTAVDGHDHAALVAIEPDGRGRILAVGRYVRLPDSPDTAEFAITVGDPYQREGLATVLVEQLADIAHEHGIGRATATMLAGNIGAHRLMYRLATRLDQRDPSHAHPRVERHLGSTDEILIELAA